MDILVSSSVFVPNPSPSSWGTVSSDVTHLSLGLAKALRGLGHRTTLIAPHDPLTLGSFGLARRLSPLAFDVAGRQQQVTLFDARLPSGVELVLMGDLPAAPEQRWISFGYAVAALARQRLGTGRTEGEPHALVAVGEQAAFTTLAMREVARSKPVEGAPSPKLLAALSRVLIPLDPSQDVRLDRAQFLATGLGPELWSPEGVEFYGAASLLKSGVLGADRLVMLGESPRLELVQTGASHRFDGVFRARAADHVVIGSGVDPAQYNPATDPHLLMRFDPEDLHGKLRGKADLLAELELETTMDRPLVVLLGDEVIPDDLSDPTDSRNVPEGTAPKTVDVIRILDDMLRGEVNLAIISARALTPGLAQRLDALRIAHPRRVACRANANEQLLHRGLGSADFLLSLDAHSRVGTHVRACMRYGTVPIALGSPGTREAVVDVDAGLSSGTGFLANTFGDLEATLQRALSSFGSPLFPRLQRRAMRVEGGFERAARRLSSVLAQLQG